MDSPGIWSIRQKPGGNSIVYNFTAGTVCKDVWEGRRTCVLRLCPGGKRLRWRNASVFNPHDAGCPSAGSGAAMQVQCHAEWKTEDSAAVRSVYCDSILDPYAGIPVFIILRIIMHKQLRIFLKSAIVIKV